MHDVKHILIRLPNWLGDMVMATAFVKAVQAQYPGATIDLIAKKGIDPLLNNFPPHGRRYIFVKEDYEGIRGAKKFGKEIRSQKKYDVFFNLPDSTSSSFLVYAVRAKKSYGFRMALNFLLYTKTFKKNKALHRAEQYVDLLSQATGTKIPMPSVSLAVNDVQQNNSLIININSEASSRRLPKEKAVSIINSIRKHITDSIVLVGSEKEKTFVDEVYDALAEKKNISNIAGKTTLTELVQLFASAKGTLTTDSGPAHISNAVGTDTLILFGAGNEHNTAPYNKANRIVMRLGKLACEPCTDNVCKIYGTPECLLQLDERLITENVLKILS